MKMPLPLKKNYLVFVEGGKKAKTEWTVLGDPSVSCID